MYQANIIQYIIATQTFNFAQNIFYQSYQSPEGLACKASTLHFCADISEQKKKHLSYILAYTVLWSSQVPGAAKYYGVLEWEGTQEDSTVYTYRP